MDEVKNRHLGRNIKAFRTLRGMKQSVLANEMGVTQQYISKMENSTKITDERIDEVGKILKVTSESLKNLDDKTIINNNILNDQVNNYNIHPLDKVTELYNGIVADKDEEINRLRAELEKFKKSVDKPVADAKTTLRKVSEG